jgi:hypothetical protein
VGRKARPCDCAYTPSHKFVRILVTRGPEQPKRAARESNQAVPGGPSHKYDVLAPRKHFWTTMGPRSRQTVSPLGVAVGSV